MPLKEVNKTFVLLSFGLLACMLAAPTKGIAQSDQQVWLEYMHNYSFANVYNMENAVSYSTLLNSPRWHSLGYSLTLERAISQNFDVMSQLVLSYTNQIGNYNTFEIRPVVGTRIHFTPNRRIQTRLYLRLEQRNLENLDTKEWTQQWRPRVRVEAIIPLNQDSYFKDNLWYAITDIEFLYDAKDLEERYANRFRFRLGLGYRPTYTWRFELMYMNQESRDGIDETFSSTDNILRVRVKYFLKKSKTVQTHESDN